MPMHQATPSLDQPDSFDDSVNTNSAVCLVGDATQMTTSKTMKSPTWSVTFTFSSIGNTLFPKILVTAASRMIAQYIIEPCHLSEV